MRLSRIIGKYNIKKKNTNNIKQYSAPFDGPDLSLLTSSQI